MLYYTSLLFKLSRLKKKPNVNRNMKEMNVMQEFEIKNKILLKKITFLD